MLIFIEHFANLKPPDLIIPDESGCLLTVSYIVTTFLFIYLGREPNLVGHNPVQAVCCHVHNAGRVCKQ